VIPLLFFLMLADALGAFFLALVGLVAVPCGIYGAEVVAWFERFLYAPVIAWVSVWAIRARAVQSGSAHGRLTYVVIALMGPPAIVLARGA
jgi:hypothetical protein